MTEATAPNHDNAAISVNKDGNELSPVPFQYIRTYDPEETKYMFPRVSPVSVAGKENLPFTDEELVERVRMEEEGQEWFTTPYWRAKGDPTQQIEFTVDGMPVTLYNFNQERPLSEDHLDRARSVFEKVGTRFPRAVEQARWILLNDIQPPSAFGDNDRYPINGEAHRNWRAVQIYPRGAELFPYRIPKASNFEGILTHELTHLIQDDFMEEWRKKFQWKYCWNHEEEWEIRPTPDGTSQRWFNKATGEMSPQGEFAQEPEQCVTEYARQNMREDICESVVAYLYDPDLLSSVSPEKFAILEGMDAQKAKPSIEVNEVPVGDIATPTIQPRTIKYYIKEPGE